MGWFSFFAKIYAALAFLWLTVATAVTITTFVTLFYLFVF